MATVYPFETPSAKYVYQYGKYIGVYPTPTEVKVLRIHFVYDPDTLQGVADTTVPDILAENSNQSFADVMVLYATAQILRRLNPEASILLKQEYYIEKDKMLSQNKIYKEEIIQSIHKDY
jgi:hypothetical protein